MHTESNTIPYNNVPCTIMWFHALHPTRKGRWENSLIALHKRSPMLTIAISLWCAYESPFQLQFIYNNSDVNILWFVWTRINLFEKAFSLMDASP